MYIKSLVTVSVILLFAGCGEEPETPIPTLSQGEQNIGRDQLDLNGTFEESMETDRVESNISIGQADISGIDENGVVSPNGGLEDIIDIAPTLIDEDVDYINTQFESIFFDYDRYSIKEEMLLIVGKNIRLMNAQQVVGNRIIIEGNCDEWGTDEYNYALGLKRAQVLRETFIAEGVSEDRIKVVTYGESNPICLEQQNNCWAKNRRVDFKLEK